jgi:hypothetical protein
MAPCMGRLRLDPLQSIVTFCQSLALDVGRKRGTRSFIPRHAHGPQRGNFALAEGENTATGAATVFKTAPERSETRRAKLRWLRFPSRAGSMA